MNKIRNKKKINSGLYVIECPKCGAYLASASDKEYLPEFSTCKCYESTN